MKRLIIPAILLLVSSAAQASAGINTALPQLKKSAEKGNAHAELELGLKYSEKHHGVKQNYALADQWFKKAAVQHNAHAEYELGSVYSFGGGVPANESKARYWYKRALRDLHANKRLALF